MKTVIVLAMHGMPPKDFPRRETAELFRLGSQLEHAGGEEKAAMKRRHDEMDDKMRNWPRTKENDPYNAWSLELAASLSEVTGNEVIVGFNEFCAPDLDRAIEQAVECGAEQVTVVTLMITRGGNHSEVDIPSAVDQAKKRHPETTFVYAWPFDVSPVAQFLATHISNFT